MNLMTAKDITKVTDSIYGKVIENAERLTSKEIAQIQKKAFNVATMLGDVIQRRQDEERISAKARIARKQIDRIRGKLKEFREFVVGNTCITPEEKAEWGGMYHKELLDLDSICMVFENHVKQVACTIDHDNRTDLLFVMNTEYKDWRVWCAIPVNVDYFFEVQHEALDYIERNLLNPSGFYGRKTLR
jgi:uncharacterized UPF0160 family protein